MYKNIIENLLNLEFSDLVLNFGLIFTHLILVSWFIKCYKTKFEYDLGVTEYHVVFFIAFLLMEITYVTDVKFA